MLPIGCLCGSTLFWVAKSSLDGYLLALLTFFCRSGSRNVGEILVLARGRMPCRYHLDFLPALTDAVPSASSAGLCPADFGRSLVRIIESLLSTPSCRAATAARGSCSFVQSLTARCRTLAEGFWWSRACGMPLRSHEQRFPDCVARRPCPFGSGPELTRRLSFKTCYLVDPASSHMLVSKIKPCMCKYELIQTVKLRMAH